MAEIKNIETLHNEIERLRSELGSKEKAIREQAADFRESIRPVNMLKSVFKSFMNRGQDKDSGTETIKNGLWLLVKNFFSRGKNEQGSESFMDKAFNNIQSFIEKKFKKKDRYYKFEDEFDSESN